MEETYVRSEDIDWVFPWRACLAWIASVPVGGSNSRVFARPYRFLGLQLAPGQYLVRHAASPSPPVPLVSPTDETILLVSLAGLSLHRSRGYAVPAPRWCSCRAQESAAGTILAAATALLPVPQALNWFESPMASKLPSRFPPACAPGIPSGPPTGKAGASAFVNIASRFRPALDWRRQYRRRETGSRCSSQPHVQRRNAMDARSEHASRQASAQVQRCRAPQEVKRALRSEYPGNQRAKRPEQYLRSSRHPQECTRDENSFLITLRGSRNSLSSISCHPQCHAPSVNPPILVHSIPPRTDTTSS